MEANLKILSNLNLGVGLPFEKKKVSVQESYSFEPQFNIPALCPSMSIPGLVKCDYLLKVDVGTSHTCILATLTVSLTQPLPTTFNYKMMLVLWDRLYSTSTF